MCVCVSQEHWLETCTTAGAPISECPKEPQRKSWWVDDRQVCWPVSTGEWSHYSAPMKYWSTGRPQTHTAALVYQVYCPTNNSQGLNFIYLFLLIYGRGENKVPAWTPNCIRESCPVVCEALKGLCGSLRQQLYNFSFRLLSMKVIFPFSKQAAVIGARAYTDCLNASAVPLRVGWADDLWAAWATFLPVAQHCANSICWERALQGLWWGFPPQAEMQKPVIPQSY